MDLLIQFWPIVVGFVGFVGLIVWLVRLEARAMDNTKEIKRPCADWIIFNSYAREGDGLNLQMDED